MATKHSETLIINQLRVDITEEIFRAIRFPRIKFLRELLSPLFKIPTQRFSEFIARIDTLIAEKGFPYAAAVAVKELASGVVSDGQENIPQNSPLIIASNHPGTYDALAIVSKIPRDDVHLIVSGIPFFRNLPNAGKRMMYATRDIQGRAEAVRKSVRHLQGGGALLIFPSGRIDPDPSVLPGAENAFGRWSRSIEVFLSKIPDAKVVLAIASGVVSKKYAYHPLSRLLKNDHEQRRLEEFMQVIHQMILKKPLPLTPKISFSEVLVGNDLVSSDSSFPIEEIKKRAANLLKIHIKKYY